MVVKKLLLILAIAATQIAGSGASASMSARISLVAPLAPRADGASLAADSANRERIDADAAGIRPSAVYIARARLRTRAHRSASAASVGDLKGTFPRVGLTQRSAPDGAINPGRFIALGLPLTRAP